MLSLDTSLAKKSSCRFRRSYGNTKTTNCWLLRNGRFYFGCFSISTSSILKGCPDRCGLVIYKQDMKAGFLHTQIVEATYTVSNICHAISRNMGLKNTRSQSLKKKFILPQTLSVKSLEMFLGGKNREDCKRSIAPETFAKKPIELHCNRHTSRGLWKQPGPRIRVHDHSLIFPKKYRHHLSQKLSERLVPNLSNSSPSLFKHSL